MPGDHDPDKAIQAAELFLQTIVEPAKIDERRPALTATVSEQDLFMALEAGQVVGAASVYATTDQSSMSAPYCMIDYLAVASERQRSGVGSSIMTEILAFAARRGHMCVGTIALSGSAGFYKKFHFEDPEDSGFLQLWLRK